MRPRVEGEQRWRHPLTRCHATKHQGQKHLEEEA